MLTAKEFLCSDHFIFNGIFIAFVDKVKCQIDGYHNQIEAVQNKNVIHLTACQLSADAGDVACDNGKDENDTFSLGGF